MCRVIFVYNLYETPHDVTLRTKKGKRSTNASAANVVLPFFECDII